MPRRPVVSRRIMCLRVKALCVDIETEQTFNREFIIYGKNDKISDRMLMTALKAQCEANTKVVHVISKEKEIVQCSIPVEEYLSVAKKYIKEKE